MQLPNLKILQQSILAGDRVALGQAITLIESQKSSDRELAGKLLANLLQNSGNSLRIGITGIPGVGKSTFIEALGSVITSQGKKLAVLAIDPSSPHSKGSILGDKTRMQQLAANADAFIRPSAAGGNLGGVANKSMETILLCEAAGYDVIIVETVGVGQSEVAVKNMTDVFVLLLLAGAGDELQGIKRGIMEMADILVINKADGDNIKPANLAKKVYENAVHLLSQRNSGWLPKVLTCSSLTGDGVETVWQKLNDFQSSLQNENTFKENRNQQKKRWLEQTLATEIMQRIKGDEKVKGRLPDLEQQVIANKITPAQAVDEVMRAFFSNK
jgi:LAO/AO transport system kinase